MKDTKETNDPKLTPQSAKRPRSQGARFWSAFAVTAVLAGGVALWASKDSNEEPQSATASPPPAPQVTVVPAEEKLVVARTERLGRIAAVETVELRPEVSGKIASVNFESGERVSKGQVLFEIDPSSYRAAVERAQARVAQAEARARTAQREADRAKTLFERRAISSEESELRQSLAAEASAELLAARAELETAQIDLDRAFVRSPIDGRVSRAYVTQGNLVSGTPGGATLLTTVVSTGKVHVYVDVDEATIQRFRLAKSRGEILSDENGNVPVELRLDQDDTYSYSGYVESLDNRIDPETGSLTVRLLFEDPEEMLLPGSFARVRIPISAQVPRIVVKEQSIGTDQSQKFVLAVQPDNTVAYRAVSLGASLGGERVITAGLEPGDRVIVNGVQRVGPGMTVEPQLASTFQEPIEVATR
ncbi:efflux RND transporter periplasmic adaptor subunit [Pelagicoccus sp. SDUM812003]|uniref:efflux RND transporter periplasmic adaptor subunit n=1 Tax=Pelagicoccus sp. SDUM812003 TaxID=3041267 RepID=UPI00280F56B7|nr:efflux RND transporter periplasmic adaptor subunit [Pelagicoccus sp. SDUM812003]MDQ8201401.1 efflux RND transporter periplasmic adaptor subunit [Pelagicoccus sp. SDUM812003]